MTNRNDRLTNICNLQGVLGCAFVDGKTGMVIAHQGAFLEMECFGEIAVEFWRVNERLPKNFFNEFGALNAQLCLFEDYVLALAPAGNAETAVFICIGRKGQVNWAELFQVFRTS